MLDISESRRSKIAVLSRHETKKTVHRGQKLKIGKYTDIVKKCGIDFAEEIMWKFPREKLSNVLK